MSEASTTQAPDRTATALAIADWRRRTAALYAELRRATDLPAAHDHWRRTRDELFAHHPASPLQPADRDAFTGLRVKPYDPAWRFECVLQDAAAQRLDVGTETETDTSTSTDADADGVVSFDRIGLVDVAGVGSLDVWRLTSYGGGIFVPVRDALSCVAGGTYGGGRYLLDTVKGADLGEGRAPRSLVLDFNFSYNPSCAYDPAWSCPLAPPGNVVEVEIAVGERNGDGRLVL